MKATPIFALVVSCAWFGGCTPSNRYGDAHIARTVAYFPWEFGKVPGYVLSLPAVSLAQRGTMEFRVSALPSQLHPARYDYALELAGGSLYAGSSAGGSLYRDERPPVDASHWPARIAVDVFAADGATLFHGAARLGDLIWSRDHAVMRNSTFFSFSLRPSPWESATAYRVRISVLEPSRAPAETLRITGFGLG